jgi:dipeptidyl aminopeptidase/acylaminoacyl peptidase
MRNFLIGVIIGILFSVGTYYGKRELQNYIASQATISPLGKIFERPLDKYTILALSSRKFTGSQIVLDTPIATTSAYTAYKFHFYSDNKKVTGLAHIPNGKGPYSVIVQFRGFIDPKNYVPGAGTQHSAEVYAANGFISLAPDFLGFGGSDNPSSDVFEERFETYTTALNLLASVKSLPMADSSKVGIWGHSNGGQIALTALEVLGRPIPATLWAPVSKPFPYSVLYYTDEAPDHGKALRRELADFEQNYDAEKYSLTNYLDRITGPVLLHQGTDDNAVPVAWSDALSKALKNVEYVTHPGADHDMNGAWNTVVGQDMKFFTEKGK